MQVRLEHRPSFGMAIVSLEAGESIIAESGAMVGMSHGLEVSTTLNGGGGGLVSWLTALVVALVRRFIGGETMFVNRFTATQAGQQLWLAPPMVGDLMQVPLDRGRVVTVQSSAFLAGSPEVDITMAWAGFSMLFSGEGAFFLRCSGQGVLLVHSYGAIEEVAIDGEYVVDSGHVLAFDGDLQWSLSRAGGSWGGAILSGEGFVQTFRGQGTVWLQTRHTGGLVRWLTPLLGG